MTPTPSTTFLVIRHAESESNAGGYFGGQHDSPLTDLGRRQAAALADALDAARIDAVYCSDLSRARATVEPLAARRGLAAVISPQLRERDVGELTGLGFDEVRARFPELWTRMALRDPEAVPPGGESQRHVAARVASFLAAVIARHRGQTVVLGSHGGTIHHVVRQLLGVSDFGLAFSLSVSNASVTRVDRVEPAPGATIPRLVYANRVLAVGAEPLFP